MNSRVVEVVPLHQLVTCLRCGGVTRTVGSLLKSRAPAWCLDPCDTRCGANALRVVSCSLRSLQRALIAAL